MFKLLLITFHLLLFSLRSFSNIQKCKINFPDDTDLSSLQKLYLCDASLIPSEWNEISSRVNNLQPEPKIPSSSELDYKQYLDDFQLNKKNLIMSLQEYYTPPFQIDVLNLNHSKNKCNHTIVILGESHIKLEEASKSGTDILKLFHFRGLENANFDGVVIKQDDTLESNNFGFGHLLPLLINRNIIKSSTIDDANENGISITRRHSYYLKYTNINNHFIKNHMNLLNDTEASQFTLGDLQNKVDNILKGESHLEQNYYNCNLKVNNAIPYEIIKSFTDPTLFSYIFSGMLEDTKNTSYYNFDIESGHLNLNSNNKDDCLKTDSKPCQKIKVELRSELMAKNIFRITENLPCGVPFLVVVGSAHNNSIIENLKSLMKKNNSLSTIL